ncbi:hypothetical protein [Bartonella sp. B41]
MLIQSLLFFILGIALASWLLVLFSPIIWSRAVHFAHKFVSAQIPSSYAEIQANYDFLRAKHSTELARNEQKYNSLQEKYAKQKIQLSQTKEQLYQLFFPNHPAPSLSNKKRATTIKDEQNAFIKNTFVIETRIMREKIAYYRKRLQEIQLDELDAVSSLQLLSELREEIQEFSATLAAKIALQEGKNSPINTLTKNSKNKKDLAYRIHKKIHYTKKTPLT